MMFPVIRSVADSGEHLYHLGSASFSSVTAGHPDTHDSHCVDVGTRSLPRVPSSVGRGCPLSPVPSLFQECDPHKREASCCLYCVLSRGTLCLGWVKTAAFCLSTDPSGSFQVA